MLDVLTFEFHSLSKPVDPICSGKGTINMPTLKKNLYCTHSLAQMQTINVCMETHGRLHDSGSLVKEKVSFCVF